MATNDQIRRQRLRSDDRNNDGAEPVAYVNEDGKILTWQGDDEAPWVQVVNPTTNPVNVNIVAGGGGGGGGGPVTGDIAHDQPDVITSFPVKVGFHANVNTRAPVNENDRVDGSADLQGRLRARISGTTGAGAALDVAVGNVPAVLPSSILLGVKGFVAGDRAHDDTDDNTRDFPVKIGGRAASETPAAVAAADRVNAYFTQEGRLIVNQDLLNAGEDLVHNVLAIVEEPLFGKQHTCDRYSTGALAESVILVKASPGRLYTYRVVLDVDLNAARWVMLFDQALLPVGGETPIWRSYIPSEAGTGQAADDVPTGGVYCQTGIALAISTTPNVLTLPVSSPVAGDGFFHVQYK